MVYTKEEAKLFRELCNISPNKDANHIEKHIVPIFQMILKLLDVDSEWKFNKNKQ